MRTCFLPFLLPLVFMFSCGQKAAQEGELPPPNVVWINVEDISPALGCYGDPNAKTPNLDRLAQEGVLFRQAFATAPICAPSRSSFITGVYSTAMGTQHLRSEIPRPGFLKTLPEHLKPLGYFCTNHGKTDWNFNPEGVFDYWEQDLAPWRNRPEGKPFFSMFVAGNTHEGPGNRREVYQRVVEGMPAGLFHAPDSFPVPPIFPANDTFRGIFARYYDLISQMDITIGQILQNLEADGLKDNTIVFFFSDHGFGLPRYKRYLHRTGTQVPLLVYAPPAYKDWLPVPPGQETNQLVSLVDLVPSVLNMLGIERPSYVQGSAFLGLQPDAPREHVFLERSRADDLFDMSRAITDGRYFYVRNYMPYLPYTRSGRIQADAPDKEGYRELARLKASGDLPVHLAGLFQAKPTEELYDLQADPYELNNIANVPEMAGVKDRLAGQLLQWSVQTRDLGFLPEAEYMRLSAGQNISPYELGQNFPITEAMEAATLVGTTDEQAVLSAIANPEGAVAYWGVIASRSLPATSAPMEAALRAALSHDSPSVRIAAAEALAIAGKNVSETEAALAVLQQELAAPQPWLALQAARSLVEIGPRAKPLLPAMLQTQQAYMNTSGNGGRYKDGNYSSFIGWALEKAIENAGGKPY